MDMATHIKKLKRYNTNAVGMSGHVTMYDFSCGEWVKFDDVKKLLNTDFDKWWSKKGFMVTANCRSTREIAEKVWNQI